MKQFFTILAVLFCLNSFAQIPSGYYTSATGTGLALKTQLKKIIDAVNDGLPSERLHTDQGYGALMTLYTHAAFRDNYYENDGSLLDMYSENPTGADPYNYTSTSQQCGNYSNEGDCYNREHLIPQSYFDNYAIDPMKNDPFFVVPSDGKVNGERNNYPFGKEVMDSIQAMLKGTQELYLNLLMILKGILRGLFSILQPATKILWVIFIPLPMLLLVNQKICLTAQ
jgi:hypothetical protein